MGIFYSYLCYGQKRHADFADNADLSTLLFFSPTDFTDFHRFLCKSRLVRMAGKHPTPILAV